MSRAWLENGRLHVQCDACSSTGTPGGAQITQQVPDGLREGYRVFGLKLTALVAAFQGQTAALRFDARSTDDERRAAHAAARARLETDMAALMKTVPGRDGVTLKIEKCPWCAARIDVTVQEKKS
jgi:hypothetical protein